MTAPPPIDEPVEPATADATARARAEVNQPIALARRFAALSGPFLAVDALNAALPDAKSDPRTAIVASSLAAVCDTHVGGDGKRWLLRSTERQWELNALGGTEGLQAAVDWRRGLEPDGQASDLAAALLGEGDFAPPALDAALARAATTDAPRAELQRIAYALEWAGPRAPGYGRLDRARALINQLDDQRRSDAIAASLRGRDDELQTLVSWILTPSPAPPVKALFVTGFPGIGKSALLERAVREAAASGPPMLTVRLDFDRSSLDVLDQKGLTLEVARQLGNLLPEAARDVREQRMRASRADADGEFKGASRVKFPFELAEAIGRLIADSGRPVAIVLDTCEVLRGRGETHPRVLFEWLDQLVDSGVRPLSVVAAGRGDAFDSVRERVAMQRDLRELAPASAEKFLEDQGTPKAVQAKVLELAGGHPLLLKLYSAIAEQSDTPLPATVARGGTSVDAAHLYRILLSRIPDPDLRRLADPGLLVRRISIDVIKEVMGPALGMKNIRAARAKQLFEGLEAQSWLIERDPSSPDWLRHRQPMRSAMVPLFYGTKPGRCEKVDKAAAEWFAARREPWAPLEALYHRLQLNRRGKRLPHVDANLATQFDDFAMSELPEQARDAVRHARGERSSYGRAGAPTAVPESAPATPAAAGTQEIDPRAVKDLQIVIERSDWIEADDLYKRIFANANPPPTSDAAHAVRTFLWRTGRWRLARKLLRDLDESVVAPDQDLANLTPEDALARLEMRAEFDFSDFVGRIASGALDRGLVERAAMYGAKTEMDAGALGFALRSAGFSNEKSWRRIDVVGAADELMGSQRSRGALRVAASAAHERMARRSPPLAERLGPAREEEPAVIARQLAVLSPYASPLNLLLRLTPSTEVMTHARSLLRAMAGGSAGWNADFENTTLPASFERDHPIDWLSDIGLLAEWAVAADYVLETDDLGLISAGAEKWRRTVAGRWAFGRPPTDWKELEESAGLDLTMAARLRALLAAPDRVAASRAALAGWTSGGTRSPSVIRDRLHELMIDARRQPGASRNRDDAFVMARLLLQIRAPAVLVPPLAVLTATDSQP